MPNTRIFLWFLVCLFNVGHGAEGDNKSSDLSFWYSFVIAYVCSATSVIVAFMYYCKPWTELKKRSRRKAMSSARRKKQKQSIQTGTRRVPELLSTAMQEQGSKELSTLLERLVSRMNFGELCEATNNFNADNVIGLGTTGMMYKAMLPNNCFLAVKRLYDPQLYKREFLLETMIPGRHTHQNIVPLVGFCVDKKERILVYKYMSNGRLQDWLECSEGSHEPPMILLEWPVRVHIALGLARGLSWLHKNCNIVHLNLKSKCVLLNKHFEPKISKFGKAKFINQTLIEDHLGMKFLIGMKGCVGKDVDGFGIILFELITGKRLSAGINDSSDSVDRSLMKYISRNLFSGPNDFYNAIDGSLIGKGLDDKILGLLQVACECVKPSLEQRPKMVDVYKAIRAMSEGCGYDSGRLKLSRVCPIDQITCNNEIECVG